jgi:hypothetical protein
MQANSSLSLISNELHATTQNLLRYASCMVFLITSTRARTIEMPTDSLLTFHIYSWLSNLPFEINHIWKYVPCCRTASEWLRMAHATGEGLSRLSTLSTSGVPTLVFLRKREFILLSLATNRRLMYFRAASFHVYSFQRFEFPTEPATHQLCMFGDIFRAIIGRTILASHHIVLLISSPC